MRKVLAIVFVSVLFYHPGFGQNLNVVKLDSLFDVLASRDLAMGSLIISVNGQVQYRRAVGYSFRDLNKKIPADSHTKYRIGSVSKLFTAVMVFQLIDEGKIDMNQKLAEYFPELPNAKKITISNLLNHRSGLHNYTADDTRYPQWMDKVKTQREMLQIIAEKPVDFEPNVKADYCNTNYLLLSYIIEKVCKMSYSSALQERIVSKIGLKETSYGKQIDASANESSSYKYREGRWEGQKETNMSIHSGAGSIVSTPSDLVLFIDALFANKLVREASLTAMKTLVDGYGMGLFPYDFDSKTAYGHNGRIEEFYSAVRYFPAEKIALSYCTNGILYPRVDILEAILKICFNKPYTIPFSKPYLFKDQNLGAYPGSYSSSQIPIRVNCKTDNNRLFLETKGHLFEAEPINYNYFMHAPTGTFFEFFPENGTLKIKETDNVYTLKRQ
ncbi:serine hydrolase domain-containing protein [Larkinella sp. GY13]|uniref:serine hydrolase domain-containing protein n=1 Tax=Larkinella sp. GY13 TaxID=3453720 RepID=UPI003EF0375F